MIRRKELEAEQVVLKKVVSLFHDGDKVSFLRARSGGGDGAVGGDVDEDGDDDEGGDGDGDVGVDVYYDVDEEMLGLQREAELGKFAGEDEVGDGVENERVCGDMTNVRESSVPQNEACESKKAGRDLRKRSSIQVRPYAIEREVYRLRVRGGGVE